MSMPSFPQNGADLTREEALTMIIASIAMEELALSHIINAEGEKLQYILGTLPGTKPCACPQDVLAVNKSVASLLDVVAQNQMLLKSKLEKVLEACPPPCPTPCPPPHGPCPPPFGPRPCPPPARRPPPHSAHPPAGRNAVRRHTGRGPTPSAPSIWRSGRQDFCGPRGAACLGGSSPGAGSASSGTGAIQPRSGWSRKGHMRFGVRWPFAPCPRQRGKGSFRSGRPLAGHLQKRSPCGSPWSAWRIIPSPCNMPSCSIPAQVAPAQRSCPWCWMPGTPCAWSGRPWMWWSSE